MLRLPLAIVLLSLPWSATVRAQEVQAGAESARVVRAPDVAKRPFLLEPGDYAVGDLLEMVQKHLQRSYVTGADVGPALGMVIGIRFPLRLDDAQLHQFIGRALAHAGLFAVPLLSEGDAGVWHVLSSQGPRRSEFLESARFRMPAEVLAQRAGFDPVMTVIPLRNLVAPNLSNELRPFFAASGQGAWLVLTGSSSGNALVASGPACRVAELIELVARLDEAAPELPPDAAARLRELEQRITVLEARTSAPREPQKK